jgi:hypothetical protein
LWDKQNILKNKRAKKAKLSAFHVCSVLAKRGKHSHVNAKRKMTLASAASWVRRSTEEGLESETRSLGLVILSVVSGEPSTLTPCDCTYSKTHVRMHVDKRMIVSYCPTDSSGHLRCSSQKLRARASVSGTSRQAARQVREPTGSDWLANQEIPTVHAVQTSSSSPRARTMLFL